MSTQTSKSIEKLLADDGRYSPQAFEILHHGLQLAIQQVHGGRSGDGPAHVSGQQLCEGIRAHCRQRFGMLAPVVLSSWGVRNTRDFGEMVFLLIEHGAMSSDTDDTIEDFDNVYDFREAFGPRIFEEQAEQSV